MLLRDAVISLTQLETALRTQVLYGGRLGTNLVELGFIDVDTLGEYLARILEVPVASGELFEAVDQTIIDEFGRELAELYGAFPLGFEDDDNTLAVALIDPRGHAAIAQLEKQCGHPVAPYTAAELRIFYHIEKHYGLERKARYVRSGTQRRAPGYADDRRRTQAPAGIAMPPAMRLEPRSKRRPTIEPQLAQPNPRLDYRDACDRIDGAEHRNAIADVLVEYAIGRFETCVVFLVRDANALGWRYYSGSERGTSEAVERLGLPLGGTSVLQASYDRGRPYRGGSPSAGQPVERRLWDAIGLAHAPAEVFVVPVMVRQRVVNLVYVHGFGGASLEDSYADELLELCVRASEAYVRLIHEAKSSAREED